MFAADTCTPYSATSATTENVVIAPDDRLSSANRPVRLITAGDSSTRAGARSVSCRLAAAWCDVTSSSAGASSSGTATAGPSSPAKISAARKPAMLATSSITVGAMALPRKPAKVWTEKARPTRAGSITEPRIE